MITINYQTFGKGRFQLRLRLYQSGETSYVNVTKRLRGDIKPKHWNVKKQLLKSDCPYYEENNKFLTLFRKKYEDAAATWKGSVSGLVAALAISKEDMDKLLLHDFIQSIMDKMKKNRHTDGSIKGSFEDYEKCEKRIQEFCNDVMVDYSKLTIDDVTPTFIDGIFAWVENKRAGLGMRYISKTLHSIISKADKADLLHLDDFKHCNWVKGKLVSSQKFNTLTDEQCREFALLDLDKISKSSLNELYRDFCLFILMTGQSPCDAISLRYSDIKQIGGISHFVFKRRKIATKQTIPCSVPINQEMEKIMFKWRKQAKDGYIFPIRTVDKITKQITNNGDIKHFVCRLNGWLKKVGDALGCDFPLHSYTFRHTAITRYISKGIPVIYVANMMGTSVENCEKIYYNNQGDVQSRNKLLSVMGL